MKIKCFHDFENKIGKFKAGEITECTDEVGCYLSSCGAAEIVEFSELTNGPSGVVISSPEKKSKGKKKKKDTEVISGGEGEASQTAY